MTDLKPTIKFEDFSKVDMRIGKVISAEDIEGSDKLIRLEIDFGEIGKRQIIAGIKAWYKPQDLLDKQMAFVLNIEPKTMMGLESQGMVLAADSKDNAVILLTESSVENGTPIK